MNLICQTSAVARFGRRLPPGQPVLRNYDETDMAGKDEEMKVRVPAVIKAAFKQLADSRFTSESEIAREAFLEYLSTRGVVLRDVPATHPVPQPSGPVSYRKSRKPNSNAGQKQTDSERKIVSVVEEEARRLRSLKEKKK